MQIAKGVIQNLNQFKDQKNILLTKSDFFAMLSQEEKEKLMVAQNNQSLFN